MLIDSKEFYWAVGIFEGEGSITHCKEASSVNKYQRRLSVAMTDEDTLRRFHRVVKVGIVKGPYKFPGTKKRIQWKWYVSRWSELEPLLRAMLPILGKRRRKAAVALLKNPSPVGQARANGTCVRGHKRTALNTYKRKNGKRECRICIKQQVRRRRSAKQTTAWLADHNASTARP